MDFKTEKKNCDINNMLSLYEVHDLGGFDILRNEPFYNCKCGCFVKNSNRNIKQHFESKQHRLYVDKIERQEIDDFQQYLEEQIQYDKEQQEQQRREEDLHHDEQFTKPEEFRRRLFKIL